MSETHRERELKFEVPDGWQLPDTRDLLRRGGSVEVETQRLESTYYDTADRALFGAFVTLRRRTGSADTGWHLKIPMDGARQEVHVPFGAGRGVPAELRELTAGLRGRAALRVIATLRTEREVRRLVDADGVGLAEIVHDTVTATVKHEFSVIRSWHEVEVELLDGGTEKLLARVARWLGEHGATPSSSMSKLGRALEASAHPPRRADRAAGVLGRYLDEQYAAIVAGDVTLRRAAAGELDADARQEVVHRTRVATRRYRSTLRVYGPLLDAGRAAALDVELQWFAAALGEVRDRHVLRGHLEAAIDALEPQLVVGPVRERVSAALAAEEAQAWTALHTAMAGPRYAALLRELRSWSADLPVRDTKVPAGRLGRYARSATRTMDERLAVARRTGAGASDAAFHRARKAAKRARYAAELVSPVLGGTATAMTKRAKKRQERLGHRQDEVVAAEFLLRLARSEQGAGAFTLGVLHQRQRDLVEHG